MTTPRIGQVLAVIAACACAKFRAAGLDVCECCLVHSAAVFPMDRCTCECESGAGSGQLTARVLQVSPATIVDLSPLSPCIGMLVEVTIQLAVFRCFPINDNGEPLTCEQSTAAALAALADEQVLRAAVACCTDLERVPGRWRVTPGEWTPHGPSGGCAGGVLSLIAYGQTSPPSEVS